MDKQLSIIVPVYNVEQYIRPCFESIFRQGLDESIFEVIIVNDGSTDRSMEMIKDIISQHHNITIINQDNQGLSVARNNGIAKAAGEYILMPDSDDLLIDYSLPVLLEKAIETKVDLVVADFIRMNDEEIIRLKTDYSSQKEFVMKEKSGYDFFLKDLNPFQCYVWRTLYRRDFIINKHLSFIPGINFQDVPFTHECYLKADRCIKASWLLNIYRAERPGAATMSFSLQKARSFSIAIANTWKLREIHGLSSDILYKLEEDVFVSFSIMVYRTLTSIKGFSERNQIMDILNSVAPDLNFSHNSKQKISTFMIKRMPHTYINLYYFYSLLFFKKR